MDILQNQVLFEITSAENSFPEPLKENNMEENESENEDAER